MLRSGETVKVGLDTLFVATEKQNIIKIFNKDFQVVLLEVIDCWIDDTVPIER